MVPAASALQDKPTSLYSLRKQLPIRYPRKKKSMKSYSSVCQVEYSFCSATELCTFQKSKNLEKFPSFCNCSTSTTLSNTVKCSWVGCCCSFFPGSIDTHHCSSSASFPLHPHSHMTNSLHSIIQTTTQLLHPTHYLASLSLFI